MTRFLLAGLVFALGAPGASGEDARVAKLRKAFEAEVKELKAKLAEAKDPEDKQKYQFDIKEKHAFAASDALDLATENKRDEAGLEAAVFALELLGKMQITRDDFDKAANLILENHVESPKISPALAHMVEAGPKGLAFLRTVGEKATNKEVQALAHFHTALALDNDASAREANGAPESAARLRTEAIELLDKAAKLAPDAKIGDAPLSKAAATETAAMKIGVGYPVPDVEGVDPDGKKVKLSSYKGKVVLFDFWATWCGPCVAMIPHEREMVEKLKGKPFALLGVNVDEEKADFTAFLKADKMPWDHWWDGSKGPLAKTFKVRAYPTLFLIDAKGVVRKKWTGSPGTEVLDKAVAELVAEAEKAKK
ncbi:MAG TPA: TlpA disulfide reductase family protein [Gemmataceae bacterium]|nr:TlpA disulfide reductase family protein [Gemmataceae bacterium]